MKLKDKIILVTGGSKGIGKGISRIFLQNGATVLICGRNEEDLKNTHNELSSLGEIHYYTTDITNLQDIELLKLKITGNFEKLDVLVNNASILGERVKIEDYPEKTWDQVINVNLNAQFYLTKALIPLLKSGKNSTIINVSSSVGRSGRAYWGAYSVSKFGLEALTQILAQELKEYGIRVNSVNPGGTRTEMRANAYPDEDPSTLPAPEDIAQVFVYLASDESIDDTGMEFNAREWL